MIISLFPKNDIQNEVLMEALVLVSRVYFTNGHSGTLHRPNLDSRRNTKSWQVEYQRNTANNICTVYLCLVCLQATHPGLETGNDKSKTGE